MRIGDWQPWLATNSGNLGRFLQLSGGLYKCVGELGAGPEGFSRGNSGASWFTASPWQYGCLAISYTRVRHLVMVHPAG